MNFFRLAGTGRSNRNVRCVGEKQPGAQRALCRTKTFYAKTPSFPGFLSHRINSQYLLTAISKQRWQTNGSIAFRTRCCPTRLDSPPRRCQCGIYNASSRGSQVAGWMPGPPRSLPVAARTPTERHAPRSTRRDVG